MIVGGEIGWVTMVVVVAMVCRRRGRETGRDVGGGNVVAGLAGGSLAMMGSVASDGRTEESVIMESARCDQASKVSRALCPLFWLFVGVVLG